MEDLQVRKESFHRPKLEVIATGYGKCRDWLSYCVCVCVCVCVCNLLTLLAIIGKQVRML